jgi:hypothetical protein
LTITRWLIGAALILGVSAWAHAESFTIDAGFLGGRQQSDYLGNFTFTGPDITFSGVAGGFPRSASIGRVGSPLNLGSTWQVISRVSGGLVLHGESVTGTDLLVFGNLQFDAVAPEAQVGLNTAPFTFTADLRWTEGPNGPEVANVQLSGIGTVSGFTHAASFGDDLFHDSLSYRFEPSSAVIPEPSTLLLLASGLGGLVASRWRKKPLSTLTDAEDPEGRRLSSAPWWLSA